MEADFSGWRTQAGYESRGNQAAGHAAATDAAAHQQLKALGVAAGAEPAEYGRLQPDCVLMDIEIEGVDGITATRQIIDAYPQARILIVTNYNDDNLRRAAREAGACRYIVKEHLLDILEILPAE